MLNFLLGFSYRKGSISFVRDHNTEPMSDEWGLLPAHLHLDVCQSIQGQPLPHNAHTRGDMAMTGLLNYCRGAGPAEAMELPPHFQGGPGAASQVLA